MVGAVFRRAAEAAGKTHTGSPRSVPFSACSWDTMKCVLHLEELSWHDNCPISHTVWTHKPLRPCKLPSTNSAPLCLPEHPDSLLLPICRVHLGSTSHEVVQHDVCAVLTCGQGV